MAHEIRNPVNDGKTQIYALHDTGSHITMSTSPIWCKLGLTGMNEQIVIDGNNACEEVEALKTSVKSKGINGKNEYDLTGIYCSDKIPDCESL